MSKDDQMTEEEWMAYLSDCYQSEEQNYITSGCLSESLRAPSVKLAEILSKKLNGDCIWKLGPPESSSFSVIDLPYHFSSPQGEMIAQLFFSNLNVTSHMVRFYGSEDIDQDVASLIRQVAIKMGYVVVPEKILRQYPFGEDESTWSDYLFGYD